MKKLYRHVKFYIKTSMKSIKRHMGMTISASMAVSITLILISMFMLIGENLNNFTYHIEEQMTIRVSIDTITTDQQKKTLEKEIKAMDGVVAVTYSSGEEELRAYKEEYGESESLFSMYDGDASPVRDAYIVKMKDASQIEATCDTITDMNGVVSADFGGEGTSVMIATFENIRTGSMIFIVFLVLIAVLLIGNKIKISIYTRREEIAVMRFVGASNWFIKAPMMLEGMVIGILGSLIPVALTIAGYQYLYQMFHGVMLSNMFLLSEVYPLTLYVSGFLVSIGLLVGIMGSFFSTTRYLRWKR